MLLTTQVGTLSCTLVDTYICIEENGVMSLVRQRLPQVVYMSYATENEMIQSLRRWRESNHSNENDTRMDTCVNGYGQNFIIYMYKGSLQ